MTMQVRLIEMRPSERVVAQVTHSLQGGVDRFVENFDGMAEAAGGVLRLRQLVLGLAINGGLSEVRRPTDVPGTTRVPEWRRERVGEIAECMLGKMLDKSKHTKGTLRPYLRNVNVRWGTVDLSDLSEMYFEDDELERYGVRQRDVLICEGGEPGRACVWTERRPVLIQKAIHRVRPSDRLVSEWLVLNLRYDTWTGRLDGFFTGATIKHFTGKALAIYEIPLPPVADQKRIVAKVDQLMAICDDLEARQNRKREVGARLTKSALDALTTAEGPEEFDVAWKRVVENFGVVLRNAEAMQELERTLRGLAYSGALVGQRNEWPAATIEHLSIKIVDCPHSTPAWTPSGIPCLRTTNFQVDGLDLSALRYVSAATYEERVARLRPEAGDILYSREGGILGIACVIPSLERVCLGQRMMLMRLDSRRCEPAFVALMLNAPQTLVRVKELTGGTASPHLNVGDVRQFEVPVPPITTQRDVLKAYQRLRELCGEVVAKLQHAEERASRLVAAVVSELVA